MLKCSTTLNSPMLPILLGVAFLVLGSGAGAATPEPLPGSDQAAQAHESSLALDLRAEHKHKWRQSSKKEWVPPLYQKKQIGTDAKGRPIYRDVMVRKGYYKVVTVLKCVKCGRTK
jgi:hypothetical protein